METSNLAPRLPAGVCADENQANTDQPVSFARCSSKREPTSELPFLLSPVDQTAMAARPGAIARIPPPTPLLPGKPTRNAKSPDAS